MPSNICECGKCLSMLVQRMPDPPPPREFRGNTWTVDNGRIYIYCRWCGRISKLDHPVMKDGHVRSCYICIGCKRHLFIRLEDWDHELIASKPEDPWDNRCPECKTAGGIWISEIIFCGRAQWPEDAYFIVHPSGIDGDENGIWEGTAFCINCGRSVPFPKRKEKIRGSTSHSTEGE